MRKKQAAEDVLAVLADWPTPAELLVQYRSDAGEWATGKTWPIAWATCARADWMLYLAGSIGVDRKQVVLAACVCARAALQYVPKGETRPLHCIETTERWARGQATIEEVRAARDEAWAAAAAYATYAAIYAANAAAAVAVYAVAAAANAAASASAAAAAADDAYAAAYAADADAADAAVAAAARTKSLAAQAKLVRKTIPWAVVRTTLELCATCKKDSA